MHSENADRVEAQNGGGGSRLLVCDDSPEERGTLSEILRRQGYEVDEAADGASALRMLNGRSYGLLVLDLQMPEVDGFEVLAYAQKHLPKLGVVLLSGLPVEEIGDGIGRLPRQELPPLLLKPLVIGQLFQVIEMTLAGELP